jgi:hypothetical protein
MSADLETLCQTLIEILERRQYWIDAQDLFFRELEDCPDLTSDQKKEVKQLMFENIVENKKSDKNVDSVAKILSNSSTLI